MEIRAGVGDMRHKQLWRLSAFALIVMAVLGGVALAKGGFYLGMHEGDAIHLAEIVLRMADGQWPHLDFMTPLGVLSAAPIALFVQLGFGIGHAILLAQVLVAALLAPFAIAVAWRRLDGWLAYGFVGYVLLLCLALVHGGDSASPSISMHYNRWAWAIAYVVLLQVLIAPRGRAPGAAEGVATGLGLAALALIKMTYFVTFAPVVLVGLIARRWWRALAVALFAGLAVVAVVTLLAGTFFWRAYLSDLVVVVLSATRERPGDAFADILGGSGYLAANLALIGVVILLRKAGHMTEGLLLFLLYVPFAYVVFQNYGNDQQWIVLAFLSLVALWPPDAAERMFGLRQAQWALVAAGVLAGAGYASVQSLVTSPFRHLALSTADMRPLIGLPGQDDLYASRSRMVATRANVALDGPEWRVASLAETDSGTEEEDAPTTLPGGEVLDDCTLQGGFITWLAAAAGDLERSGFAGKRVVAADIYGPFWLYGDLAPVPRAAPWYYGRLPGLKSADYVLVPQCPVSSKARRKFLQEMDKAGWSGHEVRRTPLYILMEMSASVSDGNARDAK